MDEKAKTVVSIFQRVLNRDPTPREISKLRRHGPAHIDDVARTILSQTTEGLEEIELIQRSKKEKLDGVTIVSPFNKICGISTYTENLHQAIRESGFRCNVCAEVTRDRDSETTVPEDGVESAWGVFNHRDQVHDIVRKCIDLENKVVHFQHEYGLFTSDGIFHETLHMLLRCGFKVIVTLHTVLEDPAMDKFFLPASALIVHSEAAASRLYAYGINNLTVIPHGTESTGKKNLHPGKDFKMVSSVGFITKNKNQKEIMLAALEVSETRPDFRFMMIGSTGRKDSDDEYLQELQALQTENVVVIDRFASQEDLKEILEKSEFCVMNYGQTQYSTSGAAHLLMTHGVASISTNSRILSDLTQDMSFKIRIGSHEELVIAMKRLLDDKDLVRSYRKAALAKGIETSWPNVAKSHILVYKHLIGRDK